MTGKRVLLYFLISDPLLVSASLAHEFGDFLVGWGTSGVPPEFHLTHVVTRAPVGAAPAGSGSRRPAISAWCFGGLPTISRPGAGRSGACVS
jgi:hypothetical protein